MNINSEKKLAACLSIVSNGVIIVLKLIAGLISGSICILSDALHSFSDFLASILTFFAVSRSSKPADKDHPFGHGKYEDMAGFIEGVLIIIAGIYIVIEALMKVSECLSGNFMPEPVIGIYVMSFAVFSNMFVSNYLLKIAKKADSVSLYADAQHLRTDIFSSFGILCGLILIKFTGIALLDPIIALIVSVVIIKTGYSIVKETLNNLLDGSLPNNDINKIEQILEKNTSICGYRNLKSRKTGRYRNIEITIFFHPDLKISDCHKICDEIETAISNEFSETIINIHPEPEPEPSEKNKVSCC